jgi:putative transposase
MTCHPRRDLALRNAEGSAPAPVASTAYPGIGFEIACLFLLLAILPPIFAP